MEVMMTTQPDWAALWQRCCLSHGAPHAAYLTALANHNEASDTNLQKCMRAHTLHIVAHESKQQIVLDAVTAHAHMVPVLLCPRPDCDCWLIHSHWYPVPAGDAHRCCDRGPFTPPTIPGNTTCKFAAVLKVGFTSAELM